MVKLFLYMLLFYGITFPQNIKLEGKLESGSLIIGEAKKKISAVYLNENEIPFDSSGRFLFGFDRDESGIYKLEVEFADSSKERKKIKISSRKYKIQKINRVEKKYVHPPESVLQRIEHEGVILSKAKGDAGKEITPHYLSGFAKPYKKGRITGVFGSQRIFRNVKKNPHNGADIANPKGTPVYAMSDGVVKLTGDDFYYSGNLIILSHGLGLMSFYLHLDKISVKEGEFVKKGQKIGEVGSTGRSTGAHLHWTVQWFSKRIDPLSLPELK
ncbi:MAG: M23 family metallopeptidase [Ignavibacteria bacterium]|nr:M23 family metallopeptidase [Ignavibacteria bacterium]